VEKVDRMVKKSGFDGIVVHSKKKEKI